MSVFVTDATDGWPGAAAVDTSMWFSLSVKEVVVAPEVRAHPSGIFTEYPPPAGLNDTYAVLSGMSPGGFDSVALGAG